MRGLISTLLTIACATLFQLAAYAGPSLAGRFPLSACKDETAIAGRDYALAAAALVLEASSKGDFNAGDWEIVQNSWESIVSPKLEAAPPGADKSRIKELLHRAAVTSLKNLVEWAWIDRPTAFEVAPNPEALKMALKGIELTEPGIL